MKPAINGSCDEYEQKSGKKHIMYLRKNKKFCREAKPTDSTKKVSKAKQRLIRAHSKSREMLTKRLSKLRLQVSAIEDKLKQNEMKFKLKLNEFE